jgi:hypothetical protein
MDIVKIISDFGILAYAVAIFFGGRWGLKYFTYFKHNKYNFLVFASVAAAVFIAGEVAVGTFKPIDFGRYFITFTVVTSCYEWVSDMFPFLKPKKEEKNIEDKKADTNG